MSHYMETNGGTAAACDDSASAASPETTMHLRCSVNAADFAAILGAVERIVLSYTTIPVLTTVLLSATDGVLSVRATDLDLTIEKALPATVAQSGATTAPARLLSQVAACLAEGEIELVGEGPRLTLKTPDAEYRFEVLAADEFPPAPSSSRGKTCTISGAVFREGVEATIFAASNEEARGAVLMGTLLEIETDRITMVATDGYRLARWSAGLVRPIEGSAKYIVPSRALAEAAHNLGGAELVEITALGAQANQLQFTAGTTSIVVRLVDGRYPDYGQVIPAKFDRRVVVNRAEFEAALKAALVTSSERAYMTTLKITAGQLDVLTAGQWGRFDQRVSAETCGDDLTIAFNARYLAGILNYVDSLSIVLELLGPCSPVKISPNVAAPAWMSILMALRQ